MIGHANVKLAKVLIVDDEEINVFLLEEMLRRTGYVNIRSTSDSRKVLGLFFEYQPDLVLLDLNMPYLDGRTLLKEIGARLDPQSYLPILVLTADITPETRQDALLLGAKDFLTKPFDRTEVLLRIHNLLQTRFLYLQVRGQNSVLETTVVARTQELKNSQNETLERLAFAAEFRDDQTGAHTRRLSESSALIAQALGMSVEWVRLIRRAAPLHDVGKIGIPDSILLKPGKLTDEEFNVMKTHIHIGARILVGSGSPDLQMAEVVALTHHEKWDGTGYARLQGEAIPLEGRIVAVADVFDALIHERPYKPAWPIDEAVAEINRLSGQHFDPRVVKAFLRVLPEALASNTSKLPVTLQSSTFV